MSRHRLVFTLVLALVVLGTTAATATNIPLRSWPAPSTWSAASTGRSAPSTWSAASTGRSTLADVGAPAILVPFAPCRLADTRGNGFTGAYGTPQLVGGGAARSFPIPSNPTCTGIAPGAVAFSLNFTVVSPPSTPPGGYLTVFPTGGTQPVVSTLNFGPGSILANAAVVPAGTSGGISVFVNFSTDLIIDINGYYMGGGGSLNAGERLNLNAIAPGWGTLTASNTTAATLSAGVLGLLSGNTTLTSAGTIGYNNGAGTGVWGWSQTSGRGVYGLSGTGPGVWGESSGGTGEGVHGKSAGGVGVLGESAAGNTAAVLGVNNTATNGTQGVGGYAGGAAQVFGVQGQIAAAATAGSAGVHGISGAKDQTYGVFGQGGTASWPPFNLFLAGGRFIGSNGGSNAYGAFGEGVTGGFIGRRVDATTGNPLTTGFAGYLGSDGLYTPNNLTVVGTKSFVEPHPSNPIQVIKYVALEGPEAGTYFRGRGRFTGGRATIEVPENFRMVTDTEGLTVQVTPIGRPAAVGVVSMGLDTIEVEATKDVEFSYLVQGVRRAYRDFKPIQSDDESLYFRPQTPDERINMTLPEELRQRLITTGIYNQDGTVNMATAERMGWAQRWRDNEARVKAAQEAASRAVQAPAPGPEGDGQRR